MTFDVPPGEIVAVVGRTAPARRPSSRPALGRSAPTLGTIESAPAAYVPQSDAEQLHYPLTALDVALMGGYRRRAFWQPLGRALRREALAQLERVGLGRGPTSSSGSSRAASASASCWPGRCSRSGGCCCSTSR